MKNLRPDASKRVNFEALKVFSFSLKINYSIKIINAQKFIRITLKKLSVFNQ